MYDARALHPEADLYALTALAGTYIAALAGTFLSASEARYGGVVALTVRLVSPVSSLNAFACIFTIVLGKSTVVNAVQ